MRSSLLRYLNNKKKKKKNNNNKSENKNNKHSMKNTENNKNKNKHKNNKNNKNHHHHQQQHKQSDDDDGDDDDEAHHQHNHTPTRKRFVAPSASLTNQKRNDGELIAPHARTHARTHRIICVSEWCMLKMGWSRRGVSRCRASGMTLAGAALSAAVRVA